MGSPWTPTDDRRLRELCHAGMTAEAIGTTMDRSRGAIEVRKSRLGIKTKMLPPEVVEKILERYEANEKPDVIALELGVSVFAVMYHVYVAGAVSERSRKCLIGRGIDPQRVEIVEMRRSGMSIKEIEERTGRKYVRSIILRTERHLAVLEGEI